MGRKKKNQSSVPRMISLVQDRKIQVPFRFYDATANASSLRVYALTGGQIGVSTTVAGAQGGTSVARLNISTNYAFFRFVRLKVTMVPDGTNNTSLAYCPAGGGVTIPSSQVVNLGNPHAQFIGGSYTVPKVLNLGPEALRGQFQWYRCDGTVTAAEYNQGYLFLVGGATATTVMIFEGVVEYKEPVNPNEA